MNQVSDVSDGSDDDFVPKKFKAAEKDQDIRKMESDIIDVKCMVTEMLEVNKSLPLPRGITKLVKEAFQCRICHDTPMKPPIIATKCCSSLIGCDECVNTWYDGVNGLTKMCPHCNEPRGYAFMFQFKGLDDFLTGMRKVLIPRSEDDNLAELSFNFQFLILLNEF